MRHLTFDAHALREMVAFLPESVTQMADVIGWETTAAMIERFGGASIPVAHGTRGRTDKRRDMLLDVLTPDQLVQFARTFGGESSFAVPRCDLAKREWRNRLFIADLRNAISAGESRRMALTYLCPRYGIGNTQAWKLIRDYLPSEGGEHGSLR